MIQLRNGLAEPTEATVAPLQQLPICREKETGTLLRDQTKQGYFCPFVVLSNPLSPELKAGFDDQTAMMKAIKRFHKILCV